MRTYLCLTCTLVSLTAVLWLTVVVVQLLTPRSYPSLEALRADVNRCQWEVGKLLTAQTHDEHVWLVRRRPR
jgi:hypothetical protein